MLFPSPERLGVIRPQRPLDGGPGGAPGAPLGPPMVRPTPRQGIPGVGGMFPPGPAHDTLLSMTTQVKMKSMKCEIKA